MSGAGADRRKVPQAFWQTVEHIGVPPAVAAQAGAASGHLASERGREVTTEQYFALWRALQELKPEPGLGLALVQRTDTAVHPPSSLAAFYARDYRDGLLRIARFKRLCSPEQLHVKQGKDECAVTVEWPYASEPEPAISTDVTFASLVELGRRGTGQHPVPLRVELTRSRPKGDAYQKYFECPIQFGAAQNRLILKPADLDRPFPGHNQELFEILTPALAAALGELQARSSVKDQVKVVLKRSLASGRPGLADVARDLGLSERTLQRRITEEGTSFRELLFEARQELGRQLLSDPTAEIDEVACLLGYQDSCSFYRAFRDSEGVTPSRWRELHGGKLR
jgi:AraC-like DNA-binding protein